jgi:hypothetical protein
MTATLALKCSDTNGRQQGSAHLAGQPRTPGLGAADLIAGAQDPRIHHHLVFGRIQSCFQTALMGESHGLVLLVTANDSFVTLE